MYNEGSMTEESLCSAGDFVEKRLDDFNESWQPNEDPINCVLHTYNVEDFYFRRSIGQGCFSTVHCVFLKSDGFNVATGKHEEAGQGYALKRLKANVIGDDNLLKVAASDLAIETMVLSNLNHENIITLHGVKNGNMIDSLKEGSFFLVLDLLVETLDTRINRWQSKQNLSIFQSAANKEAILFKRIRDAALGIAKGLEYLHSMNIMFRDLKPNNIGFDEDDQVKIFDFGLAREITPEGQSSGQARLMTWGVGTPRYMAPEVSVTSGTYGFPADVYSFTILMWQIVTTRTPFASILSPAELASKVLNENKRPSTTHVDCSDSLKSLMESGWSADPAQRPTFTVVCEKLEKMLSKFDDGNNGTDKRRGYFRRSVSEATGLRDTNPGSTLTRNFLIKKKNFHSSHDGASWNASKPKSSNCASRCMSM